MVKKMLTILGILAIALMSFAITSAATSNSVTLTINQSSISNASVGDKYAIQATVADTNSSDDYYIVFGTSDWTWSGDAKNLSGTETFDGELTISSSKPGTKSVIAKFYEQTNTSNLLFQISEPVSISYASTSSSTSTDTICTTDYSGEVGDLELEIDVMNNGQGDDEEWQYLDEIVIEVTVLNNGDDDVDDVMVELIIKDDNGNTISKKKMDLDDDEEDLGRIKDDDEKTATFTIDEVPIDMENGDYKLYVIAYSEGDEDLQCVSTSEDFTNSDDTYYEFSIESGEDSTVIVKDDIENVKTSCGAQNVEVSFMVYNIGSDDEEKVLVTLENSALGIYEKQVIDNLRDGKGKEVTFHLDVPETSNKYEKLKIFTYYDWDDDEDEEEESSYDESSEEEGDDFEMYLEIISCASPEPSIQANLNSVAKVGENLIVKARIANNGEEDNFVVSAAGYESWATLVSVDPQTSTIAKNAYKEVTITLTPTTSGAQTFKINTLVDGQVYTQSLSVNIAEADGALTGLGLNGVVFYMIIAIVAVLILIFLVLIVRLSRRSKVKVADF